MFFNKHFLLNLIIENQRITFYASKNLLKEFFQQQNPALPITSESMSEYYLMNSPWLITVSHFRHELINIQHN